MRALTLAGLIAGLLTGCARSYTVELFNASDKPVRAEILTNKYGEDVLAGATIAPGAFGGIGPVEAPWIDRVTLEVRLREDPYGQPDRLNLSPGITEAEITVDNAFGDIQINPIRLGGRTGDQLPSP